MASERGMKAVRQEPVSVHCRICQALRVLDIGGGYPGDRAGYEEPLVRQWVQPQRDGLGCSVALRCQYLWRAAANQF